MNYHSVEVNHCRTDNGIFTMTKFMTEIENKNQIISSYGVRAHHQNTHAEHAICTDLTTSRSLMLHAILQWPDQIKTDF